MEDRDRDEGGRFEKEHSDEEVLAAVRKHEPAGTAEVAGELGIARQSADFRLRKLVDQNRLSVEKVGNSLVWSEAPKD